MRWSLLCIAGAALTACLMPELNKVDGPASGGTTSGGTTSGGTTSGGTTSNGGSTIGDAGAGPAHAGGMSNSGGDGGSGDATGGDGGSSVGPPDCSEPPSADPGAIAVGAGIALQWDGSAWVDTGLTVSTLRAVGGSSPTDVWAFGDDGAGLHWDGFNWTPGFAIGDTTVVRLSGSGPDLWALNETNDLFSYDGADWQAMPGPPGGSIKDIWVSPTGKLYAARGSDTIDVRSTAGDWTEFANVGNASTMGVLAGTSDDDIWFYVWSDHTFRHWNGAIFSPLVAPTHLKAPRSLSVASSAAWAVGDDGMIWVPGDNEWTELDSGSTRVLHGVAAHAPDQAWVVGEGGTILHVRGSDVCPIASGTTQPLFAVWAPN